MTYCAYHASNQAIVHCANCHRALCASCDHRIKGFPYCQDCIVLGIESLQRRSYYNTRYHSQPQRANPTGRGLLAAIFALFPSGGAIFNRQNVKAIVQFVTIMGLAQLERFTTFHWFFGLAAMAFYFYSILDSFRTARAIAEGESAAENEEQFKRTLIKRAPLVGFFLILIGALVAVSLLQPLGEFLSLSRLIPVALIILGGYLLTRYFKQSRDVKYEEPFDRRPRQLNSGYFSGRDSGHLRDVSKPGNYR